MKSSLPIIAAAVISLILPLNAEEKLTTLESLTTTKNRTYEKVEIREVTPSGIKIRHDAGTATIPYNELPANIQKQLGGFDPQAAEEHKNKEAMALQEQEAAIDRDLQNIPEKMPVIPQSSRKATVKLGPAGLQGDPFTGGFELPGDSQSSPNHPEPPAAKAPEATAKPQAKDRGILTARMVGLGRGLKRVEFKAVTNCQATLEIHGAAYVPDAKIDIAPNANFVREVWVYNNFSADLVSGKGETLDSESYDKKTEGIGGVHSPKLH